MAHINVPDNEWLEFRVLAMKQKRSVADYLGELVRRRSANRNASSPPSANAPVPARGRLLRRVRLDRGSGCRTRTFSVRSQSLTPAASSTDRDG